MRRARRCLPRSAIRPRSASQRCPRRDRGSSTRHGGRPMPNRVPVDAVGLGRRGRRRRHRRPGARTTTCAGPRPRSRRSTPRSRTGSPPRPAWRPRTAAIRSRGTRPRVVRGRFANRGRSAPNWSRPPWAEDRWRSPTRTRRRSAPRHRLAVSRDRLEPRGRVAPTTDRWSTGTRDRARRHGHRVAIAGRKPRSRVPRSCSSRRRDRRPATPHNAAADRRARSMRNSSSS